MTDWNGLRLRFGRRFLDEARLKRRWTLDERTPFEEVRMLDPEPVDWILDEAAASLKDVLSGLSRHADRRALGRHASMRRPTPCR